MQKTTQATSSQIDEERQNIDLAETNTASVTATESESESESTTTAEDLSWQEDPEFQAKVRLVTCSVPLNRTPQVCVFNCNKTHGLCKQGRQY